MLSPPIDHFWVNNNFEYNHGEKDNIKKSNNSNVKEHNKSNNKNNVSDAVKTNLSNKTPFVSVKDYKSETKPPYYAHVQKNTYIHIIQITVKRWKKIEN
ncbi:hypothetical protein POVWA2_072270 [Plasmodium ovale wallikeri]|uniref:Uncharacterized protein n=1 Tax=Plasmodium ovale wallikeri TaxID=864142 RepID=A0A1A9AJ74_PLAOA|nr:hypothetical protein POVWA1_069970 [Plasmodium ovale wallikeri]SBT56234.1 hypothetical protein POVWA2_072270 [Plasmodium ovale wallikeri]